MPLSREERQQFLTEPHIAAIAVDGGPGRGPLTVPIWYDYEAGGDVRIITGADSRKAGLIAAAGRFSVLVERTEPSIRYVSAEGPVMENVPATEQQVRDMAYRYLPPPRAEEYLKFAAGFPDAQMLIRMRPEHWLSADLGAV